MSSSRIPRRLLYSAALLTGLYLFGVSTTLVTDHVRAVAHVRDASVPLIAETVQLERRSAVLQEQVELAQLQSALRVGSHEERVHVYVLPKEFEMDRLVALFEVLSMAMQKYANVTHVSPLVFGEEALLYEGVYALPMQFSLSIHEDGVYNLLGILKLAGMVTVADVLTPSELQILFERIEAESPAGIVALEQFLSLDLMTYIKEPRTYEEQLTRSFLGSSIHALLENMLETTLLKEAKQVLGGPLGEVLQQQKLWPTPFLAIQKVTIEDGTVENWHRLSFELQTYRRVQP